MRTHVLYLLGVVCIACVAVPVTSRLYWGHWTDPPAADDVLAEVETGEAFCVSWYSDSDRPRDPLRYLAANVSPYPGDEPYGRLPEAILRRGLRPRYDCSIRTVLPEIRSALESRNLLRSGDSGYGQAKILHGEILTARTTAGRPLAVLALFGGEMSNDHHPYYEAVFSFEHGRLGDLLFFRHYRYDVAGLEGFGHILGGIAVFLLGIALYLPFSLVVLWRHFQRARAA